MKAIHQIHIVHHDRYVEVSVWGSYPGIKPSCERLTFKNLGLALKALAERAP